MDSQGKVAPAHRIRKTGCGMNSTDEAGLVKYESGHLRRMVKNLRIAFWNRRLKMTKQLRCDNHVPDATGNVCRHVDRFDRFHAIEGSRLETLLRGPCGYAGYFLEKLLHDIVGGEGFQTLQMIFAIATPPATRMARRLAWQTFGNRMKIPQTHAFSFRARDPKDPEGRYFEHGSKMHKTGIV